MGSELNSKFQRLAQEYAKVSKILIVAHVNTYKYNISLNSVHVSVHVKSYSVEFNVCGTILLKGSVLVHCTL